MIPSWDKLPPDMRTAVVREYYDILRCKKISLIAKRLFDIVASLVLIVIVSPVLVAVAVMIKLDSEGSVFYRQERVTQYGRHFRIYKFRTMVQDADRIGSHVTVGNDPRITRVGAKIRSRRIDELPQLINVLRGEMSFVGPRPERPYFVEKLNQQVPYYDIRHYVKPGITGWAQVRMDYGASVEEAMEKLEYDLFYVKNHSLFLDFMVLIETIQVVLRKKGAR